MRVARNVEGIVYHGVFDEAWIDADADGCILCRIRYDDGDVEDITSEQLVEAFALAVRIRARSVKRSYRHMPCHPP